MCCLVDILGKKNRKKTHLPCLVRWKRTIWIFPVLNRRSTLWTRPVRLVTA